VEEGLNAAFASGGDRMQRRAGGCGVPDSFTHGSSEQRVNWFRTGIETGDVNRCNTFRPQER
jgi:predicted metalloprotease